MREQSTAQVPSVAEHLMEGSVAQKMGYSPDEAAMLAGMCRSNIFKAMKSGSLPARKLGRRTIILHDDLQNFMESLPVREAV
nr:helix-turn-helix domain-containing protein [Devosia sp.]